MSNPKAYHNWPVYDDDLVNKIYVDEKFESSSSGDIDEIKQRLNTVETETVTNTNAIINLNNTKLDTSTYSSFIQTQYNPLVEAVNDKIESYSQTTDPSTSWLTSVEKESHLGDIWYDISTQKTYTYRKNTEVSPTVYYWQWQNVPVELLTKVDGKATFYSGVVPTSYTAGDYWIIPLNCYSNTITVTGLESGFSIGDVITIDGIDFTVTTVSSNGTITGVSSVIPNTSNYDMTNTYTNEALNVGVVSTSSFTLPTNCFGGSICIATTSNSSYNSSDWVNRNSYIPQDKTTIEYASVVDLDNKIVSVNESIDTKIDALDDSISLQVNTIQTTVETNKTNTDLSLQQIQSYAQSEIARLDETDSTNRTWITEQINTINSQLQILNDRIIQTVAKSGGNNLLRNSVGFKNTTFWTPITGGIKQDFVTIANQLITISFKYKKTTVDNMKVSLNADGVSEKVILSTSTIVNDWTPVTYQYTSTVNNPHIDFNDVFIGVQDNDAELNGVSGSKLVFETKNYQITDLIINYGDATVWSPYFDEVYGKSHTLDSSGLDLLDLSSGKKSHLDSNSLDFIDSNNNIESTFAKSYSLTDNLELYNSLKIGNLRTIKLDDNNILEY